MIKRPSQALIAAALAALIALPLRAAAQEQEGDLLGSLDALFPDPSDYAADTEPEFELDEVLAIDMSETALALARQLGFTLLDSTPLPGLGLTLQRLRLPLGFDVAPLLAVLAKTDPLGLYERNRVYRLAGAAAESEAGKACAGLRCYPQTLMGWPPGGCPQAVRLGLLDSALDVSHPALRGARIATHRVSEQPVRRREQDHGTAIASLLVGREAAGFAGLLPQASLFAADVFDLDQQNRPYTDAFRLARGLDWLAQQKVATINVSIAGPESAVLQKAVQLLAQKGVAIAAAGGNQGPRAAPPYPAAYPEVLAVTAVDRQLKPYTKANQGRYLRLAAPGVAVWAAAPEGKGAFRDGSSYAAPAAAAALALIAAMEGSLTVPQRIARLTGAARDLGPAGSDPVFGAGLLKLPVRCVP